MPRTEKQARIQALTQAIIRYLKAHRSANYGVGLVLDKLAGMNMSNSHENISPPSMLVSDLHINCHVATTPRKHGIATRTSTVKVLS